MTQFDLAHKPSMAGIGISITTRLSTPWRCVFTPHCSSSSSHYGCFCFTLPPWKPLKRLKVSQAHLQAECRDILSTPDNPWRPHFSPSSKCLWRETTPVGAGDCRVSASLCLSPKTLVVSNKPLWFEVLVSLQHCQISAVLFCNLWLSVFYQVPCCQTQIYIFQL